MMRGTNIMQNPTEQPQKNNTGVLFELLQSGDEALEFLCENLDESSVITCITVSEALGELYDNIAEYIEENNINEKHRGKEAALNAALAAGKLRILYSGGNLDSAELLLIYELVPLHIFLTHELHFWFEVYPDREKMHEQRDKLLNDITDYMPHHKEQLEAEYAYDVSIMVLCYNKVYLTKIAYESLLRYTDFEKYRVEIILVNNGSDDNGETSAFLAAINDPRVKTADLKYPLGYNAYSLGPLAAQGRYFIEFHTDVVATENWLDNLLICITSDFRIGAAVAACNESSNSQAIPVDYANPLTDDTEMQRFAKKYNHSDPLKWEDRTRIMPTSGYIIPTILYRQILRDPWLYLGMFTDDDMSTFLRRSGFRQVLAKDTFLHHFGSQTSTKYIKEDDSIGQMRKRYYEKWGVDAWDGMEAASVLMQYMNVCELSGSESYLFIDPLCGSPLMYILNRYRGEEKNAGEIVAIVSNQRYYADAQYFFDDIICGYTVESLGKLQRKFDFIIIHPDISEYIDIDFPELLKALHSVSNPGTKILFTVNNPAYYMRLNELANGVVSANPFEPWRGIRFVDVQYITAAAEAQGFHCAFKHLYDTQIEQHAQIIKHLQTLVNDESKAKAMNYMMMLYVLSPK